VSTFFFFFCWLVLHDDAFCFLLFAFCFLLLALVFVAVAVTHLLTLALALQLQIAKLLSAICTVHETHTPPLSQPGLSLKHSPQPKVV
jgi:hypothetical protein